MAVAGVTITSQAQTQELGPGGNLVDVVQVTFVVNAIEAEGVVRVPLKAGWPDAVDALIAQRRDEFLALAGA